jgi:hypothetical protein
MPRPPPPITPDSYEAFVQHASENPHAWFKYIQQSIAYSETLELQITYLQDQSTQDKAGLQAIQDYQTRLISDLQDKLANAVANERNALALAIPTVPTPSASITLKTPDTECASVPIDITSPNDPTKSTSTRSQLSERIPDPPEFKGNRKDFSRFASQIHAKMITNADRFPTPQSRLTYLASRLEDTAYAQLQPYSRNGVFHLKDYQEGLDVLERAFGDPNKVNNARKELMQLKQTNKEFGTFFAEFHRLALESEMHDDALPTLLENALSKELRDQLISATSVPTTDYHAFAKFLQELENRRRYYTTSHLSVHLPRHLTSTTVVTPAFKQVDRSQPAGEPMDLSTHRTLKPLDNTERQRLREIGACFRCRKPGHMASKCPDPPLSSHSSREPFRPRAAIDSCSHHSDSDSENGMSLSTVGPRDRN